MPEEKGQHEPSMEEILASIRRIIAADEAGEGGEDSDGGDGKAQLAATDAVPPPREEEILELTEVFDEEKPVANPPDMPLAHDGTPLLKLDDELPPIEAPSLPRGREEDARLISRSSAAASVAALSQLVNRPKERTQEMVLGNVGRTLEDLVRELLQPLLKEWLDEHLPQLVERLVQEEIQRLVGEAQGR